MCKGGSSTSTVDPRILSMVQGNYGAAQNVANRPYQPYTGQMTAPMTPVQNQAGSLLRAAPFMGANSIASAENAADTGANYQAPIIQPPSASASMASPGLISNTPSYTPSMLGTAPQASVSYATPASWRASLLAPTPQVNAANAGNGSNISGLLGGFTSPYTSQVVNATNAELAQGQQQALMGNAQAATEQGAYGGDRLGVQNALTNQQSQLNMGLIDSQLNQAGFNTALTGATDQAGMNNQSAQFNASNQQQASMANATNALAAAIANQNASNTAGASNAAASNTASLFNAGQANTQGQFNAGLLSNFAQANQGAANAGGQFNTGLLNANQQFNAGNAQQANLVNAGALNSMGQFNAGNALTAAQSNQGAANTAAGLNNQAAGLLGNLGTAQNTNFLNGTNALNAFGTQQQTTQQNALIAAYQQYLNQLNYPVQMQGLLDSSLFPGGVGANTSNPAAAGQSAGGLLGALGSLGTGAAALLPLL